MGPILDLAVVALAVLVCLSTVLLAWTLGVSITAGLRRTRGGLINARLEMVGAERRLRAALGLAPARPVSSMRMPVIGEGDE